MSTLPGSWRTVVSLGLCAVLWLGITAPTPVAAQTATPVSIDESEVVTATPTVISPTLTPTLTGGAAIAPSVTPSVTLTPTPTPTAGAATTECGPLCFKSDQVLPLMLMVIVAAASAWLGVLWYSGWIQNRYFETAKSLAQLGTSSSPSKIVSAFGTDTSLATSKAAAPPPKLNIAGPEVIFVGQTSGEYSATLIADQAGQTTTQPATDVEWSVEPPDAAGLVITPNNKSKASLVATRECTLVLRARSGGAEVTLTLKAQKAPAKSDSAITQLPVFGQGYGAIIISVAVLAVLLIAAIIGRVGEGTISTLLGALLGYVFSKVVSETAQKGSGRPTEKDSA